MTDPVSITTTTSDRWYHQHQRKSFYANGLHWVFYSDGTDGVYKTSADGTTWSSPITWRATVANTRYYGIFHDGTYVHYVHHPLAGALYYRRGTTVSDGTISWSAAEQNTGTSPAQARASICVNSSGVAFIGYNDADTNANVLMNANTDGTWSTAASYPVTLRGSMTTPYVKMTLTPGGKALAIYAGTAGVFYAKEHSSGSTWGSEESPSVAHVTTQGYTWSEAKSDNHNHLAWLEGTTLLHAERDSDGTWTHEQLAGTWASTDSVTITTTSADKLYIFTAKAADAGIYVISRIGGSWDASWTQIWSTAMTHFYSQIQAVYESSDGGAYVTYIYGAGSPYTIYFLLYSDEAGSTIYINYLKF
jgi:hypothetical protein